MPDTSADRRGRSTERRAFAPHLVAIVLPPIGLAIVLCDACRGVRIPEPDKTSAVAGEGTCVPYPPPSPKVEEIPPRPSENAVWVDGEWMWEKRRWTWHPGGWAEPPVQAVYSAPHVVRLENGALAWYPSQWLTEQTTRAAESARATSPRCPPPPNAPIAAERDAGRDARATAEDATLDSPVDVYRGPVLQFAADAPSNAPGTIVMDATIPSDAPSAGAKPRLIEPPK